MKYFRYLSLFTPAALLIFTLSMVVPQHSAAQSTTISENLPVDVQVDLLMTELSRLLKIDDNEGIIRLIPQIRSLDIEIPDSLYFLEARALYRTGKALAARDRLVVYLANTGREGRYYEQATELLLAVKEEADIQEKQRVEQERLRREEIARSEQKARNLRVREVQRKLQQLGFYRAVESGELNNATREALAVYQIRHGLQVNGDVTDETLEKLRTAVPETDNCDGLARYARTPGEISIPIRAIPAQAAVAACNDALRRFPEVIRFQVQYARAIVAAGRAKDALPVINKVAKLDYPEGSMLIGLIHESGALTPKGKPDYVNALRFFQAAAAENYPEALVKLGEYSESGFAGLQRSQELAVNFYRKAADQGYPIAQTLMGKSYYNGRGVSRNMNAAFKWYSRAAEAGYGKAEYKLGEMYERGKGVKRNRSTALSWYRKASNHGYADAVQKVRRLGG